MRHQPDRSHHVHTHWQSKSDFVAQHYLIGGDWGAENEWHSHHYALELQLIGPELDAHGCLVDIVAVERELDAIVGQYQRQNAQ